MMHLATQIRLFLRREDGPTAVEYAVLLALAILVSLAAIRTVDVTANKTTDTTVNATVH